MLINKFSLLLRWYFSHLRLDYQIIAYWLAAVSAILFVCTLLSKDLWTIIISVAGFVFFLSASLVCRQLSREQGDEK
jgi:hypothetical protein